MPSKNRIQRKPTFAYSSTYSSPLPQENQGGKGRGMFFACGNKGGTSFFSSVAETESGNFQSRKFSKSPPSSEKFDLSIEKKN